MTLEERARKIRELMADHQATGGYISRKEAERIIDEVKKAVSNQRSAVSKESDQQSVKEGIGIRFHPPKQVLTLADG